MEKELFEDAYLVCATEAAGRYVAEYVTEEGERYGLLLDESFNVIARMDGLCDVTSSWFWFDYGMGSVRQSKQYTLDELVELAESRT